MRERRKLMKNIGDFLKLFGTELICSLKNLHKFILVMLILSLTGAFGSWFVVDVLFSNKIGFIVYWKWWFIIPGGIVFFWDHVLGCLFRTINSFNLMRRFKTTTAKISIAIRKFDLLKDKEAKKIDNNEDFELWLSRKEFSVKMAKMITNALFK